MPAAPPADAVRAQLDRILASPGFVNADRLSRFLRFVVERTLAGEGDQLKEYLLGTEVFDRPSDYDPRLDSIVRVEARRLRAKLAEFYAGPRAPRPDRDPRGQGQLHGGLRGGPGHRRGASRADSRRCRPGRSTDRRRACGRGRTCRRPAPLAPLRPRRRRGCRGRLPRLERRVARHRLGVVAHPGGGAAARPLRHRRRRRPRGAGRRRHRRSDRRARPASGRRGRLAHQRDAVPRPPRAARDHRHHAQRPGGRRRADPGHRVTAVGRGAGGGREARSQGLGRRLRRRHLGSPGARAPGRRRAGPGADRALRCPA